MGKIGLWVPAGWAGALLMRLTLSFVTILAVDHSTALLAAMFAALAILAAIGGLSGRNSITGAAAGASLLILVGFTPEVGSQHWWFLLAGCLTFTELYLWDFARSARRNSFVDRRVVLGGILVVGEIWFASAILMGLIVLIDNRNPSRFAQPAGFLAVAVFLSGLFWFLRREANVDSFKTKLRVGTVLAATPDRQIDD